MELLTPLKIVLSCFLLYLDLPAQNDFLFTKKFANLIDRYNLEFYQPVERWLKPSPFLKDEFLTYDLVLHSNGDFEVRLIVQGEDKHNNAHPHVKISSLISTMSSNSENDLIRISKMTDETRLKEYNADNVLFADFIPKETFSHFKKGRLICIHQAGNALLFYIILYERDLDPFFEFPIRFKS